MRVNFEPVPTMNMLVKFSASIITFLIEPLPLIVIFLLGPLIMPVLFSQCNYQGLRK